jgi:hypothetical protein
MTTATNTNRLSGIRYTINAVAVFAIVLGAVLLVSHYLNDAGRRYADAAIVKIVSGWNQQELVNRASPEFIDELGGRIPDAFRSWKELGTVAESYGARGSVQLGILRGARVRLVANYVELVKFSGGYAQVNIELVRALRGWKIRGFGVMPLKESPPGRTAASGDSAPL